MKLGFNQLCLQMIMMLTFSGSIDASSMEWVQIGDPLTPRSETGICYDPESDSILQFGGYEKSRRINETWEWDGARWNQLFPETSPEAHAYPVIVFSPGREALLLIGRSTAENKQVNIWQWKAGNWQFVHANPPEMLSRYRFGVAYDTEREKLVIYGGSLDTFEDLDELWEWDDNGWMEIPRIEPWPPAVSMIGMAYNPDIQKTVMFCDNALIGRMELWYWDGSVWEKQEMNYPWPPLNTDPQIVFDPDRSVIVLPDLYNNDEVWEWNGVNWSKITTPNAHTIDVKSMTYDQHSHRVMIFGGTDTCFYDGSDWQCYDPDPYYPPQLFDHAMAFNPENQTTLLYGGSGDSSWPISTETFEWDGNSWTSYELFVTPGLVWKHRLAYMDVLDGIVLYGGSPDHYAHFYLQMWLYRDHTWTQLHPATTPGCRQSFGMVYDTWRDRLVLFGGITEYDEWLSSTVTDETWEFDGTNWMQMNPSHHPPALEDPSMTFDSCRGVTVLFSGLGELNWHDGTWEYNGLDWTRIEPATTSPSVRYACGFCFDESRCRTIIHGGAKNLMPGFKETWEWDGYDWYEIEPSAVPESFYFVGSSMVYDTNRKCSVLYGGRSSEYSVETFEYRHSNPDICDQMGVTLELSQTLFHAGDMFSCTAHVCNNTGDILTGYPLLVLLDVYGTLFWAPSFTQEFDCFLDAYPSFPEGTTDVAVLPSFAWPPNAGSAQGIRFYAAITDPAIHILIGQWDMAEFGWE